MDTRTLLDRICDTARSAGMDQRALARKAALPEPTLSRARKSNSAHLKTIEALANAAGLELDVVPQGRPQQRSNSFREKHAALAWANPIASDTVLIRRALVQPRFQTLLDAAVEFGLPQLQAEWQLILDAQAPDALRAAPLTQRLLENIRRGYEQAQA